MVSKRAYRRIDVKKVPVAALMALAAAHQGGAVVGLDIGKAEIVACLRWRSGAFERPWSVANTGQIDLLVERLLALKEACGGLIAGMESTGTYGEAVRRALTLAGIETHRISGKSTADYQEIFDGVPSQHDGKDAAIVAELTAFGKGRPWPFVEDSPVLQEVKHVVRKLSCARDEEVRWTGRLEGLLAKHWPELTGYLKLCRITPLELLAHDQSPARLAADGGALERLRGWGGASLLAEKMEEVIQSAGTTRGFRPMRLKRSGSAKSRRMR